MTIPQRNSRKYLEAPTAIAPTPSSTIFKQVQNVSKAGALNPFFLQEQKGIPLPPYLDKQLESLVKNDLKPEPKNPQNQPSHKVWSGSTDDTVHEKAVCSEEKPSNIVVVLGMHRSGTSVIANILSKAGYFVGQDNDLMKGNQWNRDGYFERWSVVKVNDNILDLAGGSWESPPKEENILRIKIDPKIETILADYSDKERSLIKDPRFCLTFPVWQNVFQNNIRIVYVKRNSEAVVASLSKRDRFPRQKSTDLYKIYNERALKYAKSYSVYSLNYDDLFSSSRSERIKELAAFLGIDGDLEDIANQVVDRSLNHHQNRFPLEAERLPPQRLSPEVVNLVNSAEDLLSQGDFSSALGPMSQALLLCPQAHKLLYARGNIYLKLNEPAKARTDFLRAINLEPQQAIYHISLGASYLQLQLEDKAKDAFTRALKLNPSCTNTEMLKTLGQLFIRDGQYEKSIEVFDRILNILPEDIESLFVLGRCYHEINKFDDARKMYKAALEIEPDNKTVSEYLVMLNDKSARVPNQIARDMITADKSAKSKGSTLQPHSHKTSVSIIIPVFNKVEFTQQCLVTFYKNTQAKNDFEVIVVDNASTDSTPGFLEEALKRYHRLRVLTNSENLGFSRSCNQGARAAEGNYILFLNNDTEVHPGWIEPLLHVLNIDPTVAAVGSKMLFPDNTIQHAGVVVLDDKKLPDPLVARHIYYGQNDDFPKANQLCTYQVLTAACLLIRKNAFEEVGGFDEEYWNGYEDVDLCFKLQERGWLLVYQPKSVVTHYESQSGPERFRGVQHNIERLHQKWLSKIVPDLMVESNGNVQETNAGRIRPYILPKPLYRQPEVSIQGYDATTSIIILTHNQIKYTKKCIESILKETKEAFELIVVDNGSTDGTDMYLEKLVRTYETDTVDSKQNTKTVTQQGKKKRKKKAKKVKLLNKSCRSVRLIKNDENLGFAAGNNQGMAVAKGDYILLMNNDVVVTPGWLRRMISCAERSPKIGIVGPMSNFVSGPQLVKEVSYDTTSLARLNKFAKEFAEKNADQAKLIWRVVGFCMLIKRAVIDKIGGMDEQYGLGNFEDDDFSLRAVLAGFESRMAEDCFVHHFGSRTFIGAKIDYRESLHEKWEIFKKKWGMPQDLPYGSPYDFSQIAKDGFIKEKHYCPLTEKDFPTITEKDGSLYLPEAGEEHDFKVKLKPIDKTITASIIIPVPKEQEHLKKCVEGIQKHTPEPYEVIFAKNGSNSRTIKWLRQYVKENPRYQLVGRGNDGNIAKCYNEGIKASSGEYIVLLHSDMVVTKGWLTGLLECITSAPNAGIAGPVTNNAIGIQKIAEGVAISIDHLENYAKTFREKYRYRRVSTRVLDNSCMLFRRGLVEKIGLLDESLGLFDSEDLCLRATLERCNNLIAGDVFIYKHGSTGSHNSRKAFNEKWTEISAQSSLGEKLIASKALEKADELNEKGQIDSAVKILLEGMVHAPNDKRLNYAIAEILVGNRQFKDALDILNEMPLDDQEVKKLELIGYCMEGTERYDEAEKYADHALSIDATSAFALNLKGILAFKKGDKSAAEAFFKRAIEADPSYGEPYTNLGTLKWDKSEKEALNLYEKGFILSPTIADVVTIYRSASTTLGQFERAERLFRDANALHPHNKRLKYLLIDILIQQGKHNTVMKEIEEAIIEFGTDDGILSAAIKVRDTIGPMKINRRSGDKGTVSLCMIVKSEEQHLAKCLISVKPVVDEMIVVDTGSTDRTKDVAQAFGAKVYDFKWTNDFSEARNFSISKASGAWILVMDADEVISPTDYDSLRKIVRRSASKPSGYSFVTRNYTILANTVGWVSNEGRYAEEQAGTGWYPSKKVRLFSNDSRIRFENPVHELVEPSLKRLNIRLKEASIPVHHYGKLSIDKVVSKGEEYYLLGKAKLKGKADDVQSLTELAVQALELGKYEDAVELWQRVIEIRPDNIKALLNIGGAFLELGRYEDALRASKKAIALDGNLKEAVLNYSSCKLFIGDVEKSVSALETLVRREPEYPPAIGMLSTAYFIQGEKGKGLKHIDKIKRMGFSPGDYLYKRAQQFISAGRTDYATLLLEIAVESNNANRDVLSLLSQCYKAPGMVLDNVALQSKNTEPICNYEIRP